MGKQTVLNLQGLSPEQLSSLKDQLEGDMQSLSRAFDQLRSARVRFQDSRGALEGLKTVPNNSEIMVPLSSSLYVKGELSDNNSVLVDVGTGYFIKQSIPRAQEFFQKRANQMKDTMDGIAEAINQKRKQLDQVVQVLQQKMAQVRAAEQQQQKQE